MGQVLQKWLEMNEIKQVYATDETGSNESLQGNRLFLMRTTWNEVTLKKRPSLLRNLITLELGRLRQNWVRASSQLPYLEFFKPIIQGCYLMVSVTPHQFA